VPCAFFCQWLGEHKRLTSRTDDCLFLDAHHLLAALPSTFPVPRAETRRHIQSLVRIPLVFRTLALENREHTASVRVSRPQAFTDIYLPQHKNLEDFVKTDFNNRGKDLGGIIWEEDPVRHRSVAKKIAPAFSSRFLRSLEPVVHEHMDYFVARMREMSDENAAGVPLVRWTNWLAMDMAADVAWNEKMHQMRDSKVPRYPHYNGSMLISILTFATSERLGEP
jgi:cytochrome P450